MNLRLRFEWWWEDVQDWWTLKVYRMRKRLGLVEEPRRPPPEMQALLDALSINLPPTRPCPLHPGPGRTSTPFGPSCCYRHVLELEDLSPVLRVLTFDAKSIKLHKPAI